MNQHHKEPLDVGTQQHNRFRATLSKFAREWKNKRVIHTHNGVLLSPKKTISPPTKEK